MSRLNQIIPAILQTIDLFSGLEDNLYHQGKVRNTYTSEVSWTWKPTLIVHQTDRISIFDFVLNAQIPHKGQILTALTFFWANTVLKGMPTHIDHLTHTLEQRQKITRQLIKHFPEIPYKQTLLVQMADIQPIELIFRGHIGGSVWGKYKKNSEVNGTILPSGLKKWDKLEEPLFTPTTKAQSGHDLPITTQEYYDTVGQNVGIETILLFDKAYKKAYEYAAERGLCILDTKLEGNEQVLADEFFTTDSSRYVLAKDLEEAQKQGVEPDFYDKELIRLWGKQVTTDFYTPEGKRIIGINRLDPENPAHIRFVHSLQVPGQLIAKTSNRLLEVFQILTGMSLEEYQETVMFRSI